MKKKKQQNEVDTSVDDIDIDAAHSDCTDENDCGPRSLAEPMVLDAPDTCKAGGAAPCAQIEFVTFQDPLKKNNKTNATMPEKEVCFTCRVIVYCLLNPHCLYGKSSVFIVLYMPWYFH